MKKTKSIHMQSFPTKNRKVSDKSTDRNINGNCGFLFVRFFLSSLWFTHITTTPSTTEIYAYIKSTIDYLIKCVQRGINKSVKSLFEKKKCDTNFSDFFSSSSFCFIYIILFLDDIFFSQLYCVSKREMDGR